MKLLELFGALWHLALVVAGALALVAWGAARLPLAASVVDRFTTLSHQALWVAGALALVALVAHLARRRRDYREDVQDEINLYRKRGGRAR
jgi:membrane protein implicated in regulation of membrane protease activity